MSSYTAALKEHSLTLTLTQETYRYTADMYKAAMVEYAKEKDELTSDGRNNYMNDWPLAAGNANETSGPVAEWSLWMNDLDMVLQASCLSGACDGETQNWTWVYEAGAEKEGPEDPRKVLTLNTFT